LANTVISYLKRWFQGTAFTGVFDGNDHKVENLNIDDGGAGNDYVGLFGSVSFGVVRNLGLESGSVSGEYVVGGLAGDNYHAYMWNCYSTGDVSGVGEVGGLVGCDWAGEIWNCYATGDVSGVGEVGGLVGFALNLISNCHATGDVNGVDNVGGLVGYAEDTYITNCDATGDVNGVDNVGGLVGEGTITSITNCYSTGDITASSTGGGLVGDNTKSGSISNCYSTGDVNGGSRVGGLVARNIGSISNCYSAGDVSGVEEVGGLVGGNHVAGSISNCYWDTSTQTHGVTDSIGDPGGTATNVHGLPTAELHQQSTFTDWDFIGVWNIGENQTYPYLRTVPAGDINKDKTVNFLDVCIIAEQWCNEE